MSRGGKSRAAPERAAQPAPEPVTEDVDALEEPTKPANAPALDAPKRASNLFHVLSPITYALRGERRHAEPGDVVELSPEDAASLAHIVREAGVDD